MAANSKPNGGNKKPFIIGDRSDVIIDNSMKDHSKDPYFVAKLADAQRSFKEVGSRKKKS